MHPASRTWISRLVSSMLPGNTGRQVSRTDTVRILALMNGDCDFTVLSDVARRMNWTVTLTCDREHAEQLAKSDRFAVILCDRASGGNWKEMIAEFIRSSPCAAVILMSSTYDSLLWEEVTSKGGYDVLRKPLSDETVTAVVSRAVTYWRLR